MAQATFYFPRGFLWGTATSSHQVEGNNMNNNWWAWEQEEGRILNGEKSGLACDWWGGRWREDLDRAAEGHQNAHRLSIEWSRVQPTPERWDEDAIDRYREIMRGLHGRDMTPLVTLHHFSDPIWLAEMGGWENSAVVGYFSKYVRKVVEALQEYVNLWVTINEPNILVLLGYVYGRFPPGKKNMSAALQVLINLVRAHAAAYHAIHEIQPQARVGTAYNYRGFQAHKSWSPLDNTAVNLHSKVFNDAFPRAITQGVLRLPFFRKHIPEAKATLDFLGINYYTKDNISFNLLKPKELFGDKFYPEDADLSDTGFIANRPTGMFEALKWGRGYNLPMIITENGVEDADDHMRPRFIIQHVHQVWRAVNFNYPIKGYFHWTLVDNFEWERGWTQRFGLWDLDVKTQRRKKRPSADLYAQICLENGLASHMVAKYAPEIYAKIFPE